MSEDGWLNGSAAQEDAAALSRRSAAAFGALFSALTLVGVCGNSLVIIAIASDRKMRGSVMNTLLCSLAVADLLNLLACSAEWVQAIVLRGPGWLLPAALCPTLRFAEVVFLYASLLSQLTVCVERFIVIVYPMKSQVVCSQRSIVAVTGTLWLFALLFALPYALYHAVSRGNCVWTRMPRFLLYKLAECLAFYFGPLGISVALYAKVSMVLFSKDKRLIECAHERHSGRLRTRRNVVKMLAACVAVYLVCYSPIQAVFVWRALFGRRLLPDVFELMLLLNALAFASSAANPLLYSLFSERCRARFGQLLRCRAADSLFSGTTAFAQSAVSHQRARPSAVTSPLNSGEKALELRVAPRASMSLLVCPSSNEPTRQRRSLPTTAKTHFAEIEIVVDCY